MKLLWFLVATLLLLAAACGREKLGLPEGPDDSPTEVGPPPASLALDPFYTKYVNAQGLPIVSSELVTNSALFVARDIVLHMLSARQDVQAAMIGQKARVGVMAASEVTTDIPEHAHLKNDPNTDWDQRARGLGGVVGNPITTCGEENLLCFTQDRYRGENILVHEFAHSIHNLGIHFVEPDFEDRLAAAYQSALAAGLWQNTYAATNKSEYWAEGVQSWFNANIEAGSPNGTHNHVNTRAELQEFDPGLYSLIQEYLPNDDWVPPCLDE
jgi:hypothetical protein